MSNANNNPQDGWWNAGSAGPSPQPQSQSSPQSQAQSPAYQPQPNRGSRFFFWIRSSRIIRGRDRWIAGVCDGMARRLGWSTTLVRALVILTSLLFGAGAAFYALAWLLLPDETDDRILCEDATVESNLDGLERLPREPRQDRRGRYRCGSCHACLRCGRHRHHRHAPQDEGVGPMENGRGSGASRPCSRRPFLF